MPKLATNEFCTGCTACASVCPKGCITMEADAEGFLFPVINTQCCIECRLCEKACPVITPLKAEVCEPEAYAAYSLDEEVRERSSSGGVFTELAKTVFADGGVVFGVTYNERFESVHICVDNAEDLAKLCGAKYAQSELCGIFTDVKARLEDGQQVLFSGTPCQVGGLKAFLRKDYANLLTVDFVCHSVPSPMAWREYVKFRAQQDNAGELPQAINLRSKRTGWSGYRYSNLFQYANGVINSAKSGESLYMKLFVGGYINRRSCTNCQFKGYSRISDITLGDFWGIWDIAPEMDDNKGTSVVLVHSEKGRILWQNIHSGIKFRKVTLEQASQQNPAMLVSSKANPNRADVLKKIHDGKIETCWELFPAPNLTKPSLISRIKGKVKRLLCR